MTIERRRLIILAAVILIPLAVIGLLVYSLLPGLQVMKGSH